jgi:hypothetical protein
MRLSLTSGSVSQGLTAIGTGVAVMLPDARWIGGLIVLVGILTLIFDVKIERGYLQYGTPQTLPRRLAAMAPQLMMFAGILIFLAGLAWFIHNRSRGPIEWTWNQNSPISFWRSGSEPLMVYCFNIQGRNRSDDPITHVKASIRSDITGKTFQLMFVENGTPVSTDGMLIPPGQQFTLHSLIPSPDPRYNSGMYADAFKVEYGKLKFVFRYDEGGEITKSFSEDDIKSFISMAEHAMPVPPLPSGVKRMPG